MKMLRVLNFWLIHVSIPAGSITNFCGFTTHKKVPPRPTWSSSFCNANIFLSEIKIDEFIFNFSLQPPRVHEEKLQQLHTKIGMIQEETRVHTQIFRVWQLQPMQFVSMILDLPANYEYEQVVRRVECSAASWERLFIWKTRPKRCFCAQSSLASFFTSLSCELSH